MHKKLNGSLSFSDVFPISFLKTSEIVSYDCLNKWLQRRSGSRRKPLRTVVPLSK